MPHYTNDFDYLKPALAAIVGAIAAVAATHLYRLYQTCWAREENLIAKQMTIRSLVDFYSDIGAIINRAASKYAFPNYKPILPVAAHFSITYGGVLASGASREAIAKANVQLMHRTVAQLESRRADICAALILYFGEGGQELAECLMGIRSIALSRQYERLPLRDHEGAMAATDDQHLVPFYECKLLIDSLCYGSLRFIEYSRTCAPTLRPDDRAKYLKDNVTQPAAALESMITATPAAAHANAQQL